MFKVNRPHTLLILAFILLTVLLLFSQSGPVRAEAGEPPEPGPAGASQQPTTRLFLPMLEYTTPPEPGEPQQILVCSAPRADIPDNQYPGTSDSIQISTPGLVWDLNLALDIDHTWTGDIVVELSHLESGKTARLINRPGEPDQVDGCRRPNIFAILDDEMTLPVEHECLNTAPLSPYGHIAISGMFTPDEPLSLFDNDLIAGTWQLTVSDADPHNTGELSNWCLLATVNNVPVAPETPPSPPNLPARAFVQGVTGQNQAYNLDCETRVAVDWAAFFGHRINEDQFFNRLRKSDNPDKGFVGNVHGTWGKIPPNDYGVHAEPVARLLREYGVEAYTHHPFSWDELRAEIAAGRPVYVFVVGSGGDPGSYYHVRSGVPILYEDSDGQISIVAHYEHTVMVIGYDPDYVTIRDGASVYQVPVNRFLRSWSALGNMAITARP